MARMNDRGQILLIGAITIAVTFLSLAIVLNGSLHTPSIAAEASDDVTGTELEEVRDTIRQEAGELIQTANTATLSDPAKFVEQNVTQLGNSLESYFARKDVALSVGEPNARPGQSVSKTVTNTTNSTQYNNIEVRLFNVNSIELGHSDTVNFTFDDAGATNHVVQINETHIDYNPPAPGQTCPHGGWVGITNATTGNGPCQSLEFVENLSGNYRITVEENVSDIGSLTYNFISRNTTSGDLIYDVKFPIEYRSPTVAYNATMIIAPGEP